MPLPDNFIEIDFLAVETAKSGDAIAIRYNANSLPYIHVVDGGFTAMGETIVDHIQETYTNQSYIDHVVLTHPDQDHALGLKYVLENCDVKNLWMNRPWLYAQELLAKFENCKSKDWLEAELKRCYPLVVELEKIANDKSIPIHSPLKGQYIGAFHVMSPSKEFLMKKIVESTRTPKPAPDQLVAIMKRILYETASLAKAISRYITAKWGDENLPNKPTSAENEMSVIQYAEFGGVTFLLTGDAGREALEEFVAYAPSVGLALPGIDKFQVPHHGSRRNVSSELLDRILGKQLAAQVPQGQERFTAIVSSALEDEHHPKKAVERALHHRGAKVLATEGTSICTGWNRPHRQGWSAAPSRTYPEEQEA